MHVYELSCDCTNYQTLITKHREDVRYILEYFNYKTIAREAWRPLEIEVLIDRASGYDGRTAPLNDYPDLGATVFSRRAVECLGDLLDDTGTLLPVIYEGETGHYFAFDMTRVINALDEANSEVKRFDDGRVMRVVRYKFNPSKLVGESIFKIPQQRSRIYVTDTFVRRVNESGLTGFSFKELWSNQDEKPAHRVA